MAGNQILVVFFSRTGTTRKIASLLTKILGAQAEEIAVRPDRSGPFGYVRSLVELSNSGQIIHSCIAYAHIKATIGA